MVYRNWHHFLAILKIATSRCPLSSKLKHTSKKRLFWDFIMEGEIIAIVSDSKLITDTHKYAIEASATISWGRPSS